MRGKGWRDGGKKRREAEYSETEGERQVQRVTDRGRIREGARHKDTEIDRQGTETSRKTEEERRDWQDKRK